MQVSSILDERNMTNSTGQVILQLRNCSSCNIVNQLLGYIGILLGFSGIVFILIKRNTRIIKSTSLFISMATLIGILLGNIPMFLASLQANALICTLIVLFHNLSFALISSGLLIKIIRIFRIIQGARNGILSQRLISEKSIILQFLSVISFHVSILSDYFIRICESIRIGPVTVSFIAPFLSTY